MYVNVLVRHTICDTWTICKIQENANFTNRTFVAQIELSQIEGSICQIEGSICETSSYLRLHGHYSMLFTDILDTEIVYM